MAEGVGVKAAFLPYQAGEKSGVKAVALAEHFDGIAGVIDKMLCTDAMGMAPFLGAAFWRARVGTGGSGQND